MATVKAYADRGAMITHEYPNSTFDAPADLGTSTYSNPISLTKFAIPTTLNGKEIQSVGVYAYGYGEYEDGWRTVVYADCGAIRNNWSEKDVTYNTRPMFGKIWSMDPESGSNITGYQWLSAIYTNDIDVSSLMMNGAVFEYDVYTYNAANNKPYLEIEYIDPTIYLSEVSPQSGYVPKNSPTIFSWKVAGENYVYGQVNQTSGTLEWRAGTSGTIKSINVGSAQQYTIPAGTFTADEIQWRITVSASGQTKTSPWYTLSTVEVKSTANLISPVSGFIDGTKPVTFLWDHIISTGTTQTGFDLQTSTDGIDFTTLASAKSSDESITFPANTFDAGKLYWRVRTYNTDDNPGEWSNAAQVTVIGAPAPPIVTLDDISPRPSVRWQSTGQQGYEVQIDGVTGESAYGTAKTYRSWDYLDDGQHTIRVRVQNKYGLWSDYGSVSVKVEHLVSFMITLNAYGGNQATLSWNTSGGYHKYYVYRDGALIAKTTEKNYVDNMANGAHRYYVRGAFDNSADYGVSNSVSVDISPETTIIATVDGEISVELPYSETNKRNTTLNHQLQTSTMYFSGSDLPSVEISEWTDRKITISAAIKPGDDMTRIMSLVGKTVCVRDQYGNCVIGVLPGWTINSYEMYTVIQTTIQDINWRETIRHDPIT